MSSAGISAWLTFGLGWLLCGCSLQPTPWHLDAHKEGDTVQLCIAHESTCPQQGGISMDSVSVYQYDSMAENHLIWDADSEVLFGKDNIDGVITYGIPPKGWRNKLTPPALVCGKAYLVNPPALFFALQCDGTVVVFDFQHLENFFRHYDLPPPKG